MPYSLREIPRRIVSKFRPERLEKAQIDEHMMYLDPNDGGISKVLLRDGAREREFMGILKRVIAPDDVCLDVGANIGYTTLAMCARAKKVIAVEPDPHNFRILKKNIKLNGYTNSTSLEQIGLSDYDGATDFWLASKPNLNSVSKTRFSTRKIKIVTKTLGTIAQEYNEEINFIKMDIEGSEVEVLGKGCEYFQHTTHGVKILLEVHPQFYDDDHSLATVFEKLFSIGFIPRYIVSTPIGIPELYKSKGYSPKYVVQTDGRERGVYENVSPQDVIELACFEHLESGSRKVTRSVMLERYDS
jgi:FkbM family methyltransferase